jgi:UDP-N-acetylglucosamine--N-acetylmuramyl-(pentapeptide) pyrophosphoryl-undecaprenol N-acetylglucosamine transferase
MRIIFTGGGTGGHFYPIIAVAEALREVIKEKKLLEPEMFFLAPEAYNKGLLYNNGITFKKVNAGKLRRYTSILNFFDLIKTFFGIIGALWTVFWIFPDVVFSKGGYGSFPVVFSAKILGIPIIIHESDSEPGRVNKWAGKFAKKIAISYGDASQYFSKKDRIALTGNPIRKEIMMKAKEGGYEFLDLSESFQTILILGGSQGAKKINDAVLDILPDLLEKYQIIHQTGEKNFQDVVNIANFLIEDRDKDGNLDLKSRYKPFPYLNDIAMRTSAGVANLIITRAGSALFEIANWEIPTIIIPIPEEISHDQTKNAFAYARTGAGVVIEEANLKPIILRQEIERILENKNLQEQMKNSSKNFAKPEAAKTIAEEIMNIILKREK